MLLVSFSATAQFSRHIIVLKDKRGTTGSLSNPSAYLSARSMERRTGQKIAIDSTDLPVSTTYLQAIAAIPNVTVLNASKWLNQVCIRTTDAQALAAVQALPFVKATAPLAPRLASTMPVPYDKTETVQRTPNQRTGSTNANLINYGYTLDQVQMHHGEYLHNQGFTGAGMRIAVLDAGFMGYKTNPAFDSLRLQNRVLGEWDFVANETSVNEDNAHGMYCLSIIAANRPGAMVGTAPHAGFYLYRTEDAGSEYPVEEQFWIVAAERADSIGANMISSSLGYSRFDNPIFDHSYAQRNGNTAAITVAADLAAKKGIIVMNSAGNTGAETSEERFISCPADGDSVVAVGAVDVNRRIAAFSSWGPNGAGKRKPSIVSLGQGTIIAGLDGSVTGGSGTSFSNPNIAGLIACLWQAFPQVSNMTLIDAVQRSADRYTSPDDRFGYGIPDLKKAFAILTQNSFRGQITASACSATIAWSGTGNQTTRYDIEKKSANDITYTPIATVTGKQGIYGLNNYSYTDVFATAGQANIQYRIRQYVQDTSVLVMDTAVVAGGNCTVAAGITVAPNPFARSITLRISTSIGQPLSIAVYNTSGQQLYGFQTGVISGSLVHEIPMAGLPAGTYIVTVRHNRRVLFSEKVVKGHR